MIDKEKTKGSRLRGILSLILLIVMLTAPLVVGLLGYHFMGPLGAAAGFVLMYFLWKAGSMGRIGP